MAHTGRAQKQPPQRRTRTEQANAGRSSLSPRRGRAYLSCSAGAGTARVDLSHCAPLLSMGPEMGRAGDENAGSFAISCRSHADAAADRYCHLAARETRPAEHRLCTLLPQRTRVHTIPFLTKSIHPASPCLPLSPCLTLPLPFSPCLTLPLPLSPNSVPSRPARCVAGGVARVRSSPARNHATGREQRLITRRRARATHATLTARTIPRTRACTPNMINTGTCRKTCRPNISAQTSQRLSVAPSDMSWWPMQRAPSPTHAPSDTRSMRARLGIKHRHISGRRR